MIGSVNTSFKYDGAPLVVEDAGRSEMLLLCSLESMVNIDSG